MFSLLAAASFVAAANPPSVLPLPQKMVASVGTFKFARNTRIYTDAASRVAAEYLAAHLRKSTGYKFEVSASSQPDAGRGAILLTTADAKASLATEG